MASSNGKPPRRRRSDRRACLAPLAQRPTAPPIGARPRPAPTSPQRGAAQTTSAPSSLVSAQTWISAPWGPLGADLLQGAQRPGITIKSAASAVHGCGITRASTAYRVLLDPGSFRGSRSPVRRHNQNYRLDSCRILRVSAQNERFQSQRVAANTRFSVRSAGKKQPTSVTKICSRTACSSVTS